MQSLLARAWTAAAVAMLAACRYQPTPVPLEASRLDLERLAGRWEGTFESRESGRSGNIVFTIQAGKDTAYGDVLMFAGADARGWPQRVVAADVATGEHAYHAASSELLRVRFVSVRGGIVEGALEPYIAPDCRCRVNTTFLGALEGNSIRGEYVTTGDFGLRQSGTWHVSRKAITE